MREDGAGAIMIIKMVTLVMITKMLLEAGRVIRSNEEDGAKMIIEMVIKTWF